MREAERGSWDGKGPVNTSKGFPSAGGETDEMDEGEVRRS